MAINMNQIDFEAIRERKDAVREDEQAHERKKQKSQQKAAKDLQAGRTAADKAIQESQSQAALNLRDLIEQGADRRADKQDQSQMDRLALAAALQMIGDGGKLPEGFDYKNLDQLLQLAGAAGAAQRGEQRVEDALNNFKLVDPVTGEPRSTEEIQRLVGDQLNAYRQASGEADPIQELIDAARGKTKPPGGTDEMAPAHSPVKPQPQGNATPAKSSPAPLYRAGSGQPAPTSPAPTGGAPSLAGLVASRPSSSTPLFRSAQQNQPGRPPALNEMPLMVDGQLTRMPPMVDGKPTNGTAAPAANTLAAALSQLLKIPGVSQAQAAPATSPTGLPQLNPTTPALSLPDVVDGKRI